MSEPTEWDYLSDELQTEIIGYQRKIKAASDLLEAISLWFYKRQGMEEPNWTEQYKSVCRLFEPEETQP